MKNSTCPAGGIARADRRHFTASIGVEFGDGPTRRRVVLVAENMENLTAAFARVTFDEEPMRPECLAAVRLLDAKLPCDMNSLAGTVRAANEKWWQDLETGEPIERNKGELLMLIVSEIAEAMEGERKGLMDDKLPHRRMAEVELADAIIRILDYAGGFGYDLEGAFREKMAYNATRTDHSHEARKAAGGKKF